MANWRRVPDYFGYVVSDEGTVRSLDRFIPYLDSERYISGRELKGRPQKNGGHLRITLLKFPRVRHTFIHSLVLEAFVGPKPKGAVARHLDGNPANNRLENLTYGTPAQNSQDAIKHGTTQCGERNVNAKLSARQILEIRCFAQDHRITGRMLAGMYGVTAAAISYVIRKETWTHVSI